jgi:hypothetical protein
MARAKQGKEVFGGKKKSMWIVPYLASNNKISRRRLE